MLSVYGQPVQLGALFPQNEIGANVDDVRCYVAAVEEAGFDHIVVIDHVIGADVTDRADWPGPYTIDHEFHECLTMMAFLAGITDLGLLAGVLVLPQRQTVLVAKQAAQIDLLSNGRLRLGVGLGWNPVEYEALGMDFHTRGSRIEEQIDVLRRLWTEERIDFRGTDHVLDRVGIRPLPVQRPIPLWMGAVSSRKALGRVGRLADGYFASTVPGRGLEEGLEVIHQSAREAGRDPAKLGFEGLIPVRDDQRTIEMAERWRAAGITHLAVSTDKLGFTDLEQHAAALKRAGDLLG